MIESLTVRPGMLVVCLSMGWDEDRLMVEVAGGFCAIGCMAPACALTSFTPHFCRVQSPVVQLSPQTPSPQPLLIRHIALPRDMGSGTDLSISFLRSVMPRPG